MTLCLCLLSASSFLPSATCLYRRAPAHYAQISTRDHRVDNFKQRCIKFLIPSGGKFVKCVGEEYQVEKRGREGNIMARGGGRI